MCLGLKAGFLAIILALAFASGAVAAQTPSPSKKHYHHASGRHRTYIRGMGQQTARRFGAPRRGAHYVALVGDPYSGYGFYPLPAGYRIGALRYHWRHQRPPWQNPVLFAIAADAARYYDYDWIPGNRDYAYGVFNPYDGVGTPFFGGWYGPSGDEEETPPFPFGGSYPP